MTQRSDDPSGSTAPSPGGAPRRPRRPDESMTLLTEMMTRPLDPSYAAEAERRRSAGLPPARARSWLTAAAAFVIGLLFVVAALTLREPKAAVAAQKAELVSQIHSQQKQADALQAQDARLREEISALESTALQAQDRQDLTQRLAAAQAVAGAAAVSGPGVVLTIDNSPRAAGDAADGNPRTSGGQDTGTVIARDLQVVVNGLWASGAEAVSVNGQRLTATAAIRFAGDAILVDYRPLARPYVVTAIGKDLEQSFVHSSGGAYVQDLADSYGIVYSHATKDTVTCPVGSVPPLRHARAVRPASPSATPSSTRSETPS